MPMRVLDSKLAEDRAVAAQAPLLVDYASEQSKQRYRCVITETSLSSARSFSQVLLGLDALGIAYNVDPRLVRGLDY